MIKRIARWLHDQANPAPDAWESRSNQPRFVDLWVSNARALLDIIRDPSDAMVEAGADYVDRMGRIAVDGVWIAMIDAAIREVD